MDTLYIAIAFFSGLVVRQIGLPPLVGFLAAGFVLHALGRQGGEVLDAVADVGVTLMLFTIGLKLRVRSLLRPEIWAGTALHTGLVTVGFAVVLFGVAGAMGPTLTGGVRTMALLIAFALSFSSTVFAVKSLEESGEMGALHGRTAIGILIMQDLIAVAFLTASMGKIPTIWAIPLLAALVAARPLMGWLLTRSGHGELITLCGLFIALVLGAHGFEVTGLKADLGALFVGVLVGAHPKAKELGKSLLSLTDLFLVGFFLCIGLDGFPTGRGLLLALIFVALLPLKSALFFLLLTRFRLRARTAWFASINLSTFSEFGLIVLALGADKGWIPADFLAAMAVTLSLSFVLVAPLNRRADFLYEKFSGWLRRFEVEGRHPDDLPVRTDRERIAIFGMGRVGLAAYSSLQGRFPGRVIGFDRDPTKVEEHQSAGRNVVAADATDSDFWQRVRLNEDIDLVVLAMPKHAANLHAAETLKRTGYEGVVAATAKFDDEAKELRAHGVDSAFNLYNEAGTGFARHVATVFRQQFPDLSRQYQQPEE